MLLEFESSILIIFSCNYFKIIDVGANVIITVLLLSKAHPDVTIVVGVSETHAAKEICKVCSPAFGRCLEAVECFLDDDDDTAFFVSKFRTCPAKVTVNVDGATNRAAVPGSKVKSLSQPEPAMKCAEGVHVLNAEFHRYTEVQAGALGSNARSG